MSGADGLETAVEDGCAIGLVDAARDARGLEQVRGLLKASGLGLDADVELFATARDASGRLLACLGLAGDVVKCAASAPEVRGEGVTARLMPVSYTHLDVYKRQDPLDREAGLTGQANLSRSCLLYTSRCV